MYTGARIGEMGWIGTIKGRIILTNVMKIVCISHVCHEWTGPLRRVVAMGHLRWSDWVSCRTSQIWGSWCFPRFLMRDGSLTQIHMAFLMVLLTPCASLPTIKKQSMVMGCPVVGHAGRWVRGLWDVLLAYPWKPFLISLYIPSHSLPGCTYMHILPHSFVWWYPCLFRATNRMWMVLLSLKCTFIPRLLHAF